MLTSFLLNGYTPTKDCLEPSGTSVLLMYVSLLISCSSKGDILPCRKVTQWKMDGNKRKYGLIYLNEDLALFRF